MINAVINPVIKSQKDGTQKNKWKEYPKPEQDFGRKELFSNHPAGIYPETKMERTAEADCKNV